MDGPPAITISEEGGKKPAPLLVPPTEDSIGSIKSPIEECSYQVSYDLVNDRKDEEKKDFDSGSSAVVRRRLTSVKVQFGTIEILKIRATCSPELIFWNEFSH